MSTPSINPMDPIKNPQGPLMQDPTKGPASAYYKDGVFVPQPIGQAPTRAVIDTTQLQAAVNQARIDSQQGKPVNIDLNWLLAQPDSPSKAFLINLVAMINAHLVPTTGA